VGEGIEIEIYMPNKDIGFLSRSGNGCHSVPFTRYGTLPAQVTPVEQHAFRSGITIGQHTFIHPFCAAAHRTALH
jgi:hypothetical protein